MNESNERAEAKAGGEAKRRYALTLGALAAVQVVLGYEWLISGLTKLVRGGFPEGLAANLLDDKSGMSGWYWRFLDWLIVPNARPFGYLIEWGEVLIALALVGTAAAGLFAWSRLGVRGRIGLLGLSTLAAVAGLLLNIAFHLANGSSHPWLLGKDPFDEGVDLDMFMALLQLVLIAGNVTLWRALRRTGAVLRTRAVLRPLARPRTQER